MKLEGWGFSKTWTGEKQGLPVGTHSRGQEAGLRRFCSNREAHGATCTFYFTSESTFPPSVIFSLAQDCVLAAQVEWQAEWEQAREQRMFSAPAAVLSKPESKPDSSR